MNLTEIEKHKIRRYGGSQRNAALGFFRVIYPKATIADECWKWVIALGCIEECPRKSIRRACSVLTRSKRLEILKHDTEVGDFDRENCKYRYIPQRGAQMKAF